MTWLAIGIAAVVGYLAGSLSTARFVARIFAPEKDLTRTKVGIEGSDKQFDFGFVSATTVSMHMGSKFGFLTMVLDMLKIILPVLAIKRLLPDNPYFLITALTGMMGHIWPLYYKFKGGRGILAVYGGLFAIDWIGVFATWFGGMFFGLVILRDVLVAYLAGVVFIIPWLWFRTHNIYYLLYAIAVNLVLAIGVVPEVRQWLAIKKEDKWDDPTIVFQLTGMGRGIIKIARLIGVVKKDSAEGSRATVSGPAGEPSKKRGE